MSAKGGMKGKFARSAGVMALAKTVEQPAIFTRNLILANMLGAENQGVAATFAIAMTFFEMLSDFAVSRLLIQADDGEDPRLQASAQAFEVGRGFLSAAVLLLAAEPIAAFFKSPEAVNAFRVIALIPIIKGFEHLDIHRIRRQMRFGKYVWATLVPQLAITALAYPVALWTRDYWAWAYLLLIQAFVGIVASHIVAERPFSVALQRDHVRRMIAFGFPLLLSSIVYFAVLNGDRTAVARHYSKLELGVYANVLVLAMMAGRFVTSIVTPLILPVLSMVKNDDQAFRRRCERMSQLSAASTSILGLGFILAGPPLLRVLYIPDYWAGGAFIGLLGVSAAIRCMRILPNGAQMARADNTAVLYGNIVRLTGVGLAFAAAISSMSLVTIAACAVAGEALSITASVWMLDRRQGVPFGLLMRPVVTAGVAWGVAGLLTFLPIYTGVAMLDVLIGGVLAATLACAVTLAQPALREEIPVVRSYVQQRIVKLRSRVA